MSTTTYSFADVNVIFSHPSIGQYSANGQGIGNITTTMSTDRTQHEVAADGSVMVSKIEGRNASLAVAIQQTSALNKWLNKAYNYLETAPADQWAQLSIVIRSPRMQEQISATGVSFQKLADKPYQQQGQQVNWNFPAADVQQDVI